MSNLIIGPNTEYRRKDRLGKGYDKGNMDNR